MPQVRVASFFVSLDGYGAGPDQGLDDPMGKGGSALHRWVHATRAFGGPGSGDADDAFADAGFANLGAWVMGRNMFGPVRGPWPDESWRGWWGEEPIYRCPVFVLTHHPRPSLEVAGGTVFHFVTDGLENAMARAREAAGDRDVRLGGGVATVRAALAARLVDRMHVAVAPILLGGGEHLWAGLDLPGLGYRLARWEATPGAIHLVIDKG